MSIFHFWRYTLFFIGIGLLFACTTQENNEVIDATEFLPKVEGDYTFEEDTLPSIDTSLTDRQTALAEIEPTIVFETENELTDKQAIFLPNRLGYQDKEEYYFTIDSLSYHYIYWQYEDSVKTINAFYNWLDCFNKDCRSIRINEERNGNKNAFHLGETNSGIYYLEGVRSIPKSDWVESLMHPSEEDWNYFIKQAPWGKMKWTINRLDK